MTKQSHYFVDDPLVQPDKRQFAHYFGAQRLQFTSDAGLFSHGAVDGATDFLLRTMAADAAFCALAEQGGALLDLGCGWGAVGVTLGAAYPKLRVLFADVNPKALRLAEKNAADNHVAAEFVHTDGFAALAERCFDCIAVNPPIHAGKDVCRRLLTDALSHLTPQGALYVVMHKKHGALSMLDTLAAVCPVEILAREKGKIVFKSEGRGQRTEDRFLGCNSALCPLPSEF
ncbi:MAG: methyltransferase [Oscillospiraceae bacterium]|jgi:16S rRNA (guanine1207-N2)-methyltransferase|nr:methyltransferase [Oscillospiraceae bacterium]